MTNKIETMDKRFQFKTVDAKWAQHWVDQNCFHEAPDTNRLAYSIVIPPPNVTGILHMGHALNNTLQDIMIRYQRMQNKVTSWMPGTDHAGIATQNVVEKQLAKENLTRHDIGREAMLDRLWSWKKEYGDTIIHQLKKLGASCDWPRTRFTMDDEYSQAVQDVFLRLYDKGLIYKGEYIINWCPRCQTALSDEEAEHQDTAGHLYHMRYPFKDNPADGLIVATTRPETMLGDTAVAVHPDDKRYKKWIGKTLLLPFVNREIPIIADEFVDPEFGSGAVKVTPSHDPNDFDMGKRHQLPMITVMHPDGRMNDRAAQFSGMDRFEARKAVVAALKEKDLLIKIDDHQHAVGQCYRCHSVVEPYLSKQWFVKMKPLAEPALKAVTEGSIRFHPQRWTKVYTNWMENIRDWCISRQIWWGHRIPVWYDTEGRMYAAHNEAEARKQAQDKHQYDGPLTQDQDVMDTWFSSWLWPFVTYGWPNNTDELKCFYPTQSLFTASEIIFFWVARMVMAGIEFIGEIPFSDVYIHGTVRDTKGRKMSKSLGNAIDPLEIIEEYGADALRFSLILNSGQDLYVSKEKFEIGRNFANKVWNATRLVLMNVTPTDIPDNIDVNELDLPSRWIISRLEVTLKDVGEAIEHFRYSEAENLIYDFFWGDFCDWYLEMIKDRWDHKTTQWSAITVLRKSIAMMHPFIPFVTEEIWQHLNSDNTLLALSSWPKPSPQYHHDQSITDMRLICDLVSELRNIRALWRLPPKQALRCIGICPDADQRQIFLDNVGLISRLAHLESFEIVNEALEVPQSCALVVGRFKGNVPLGDLIDMDQERKRLSTEIEQLNKAIIQLDKRLNNKQFLAKAPEDVVNKDKDRLANMQQKKSELDLVIQGLPS